MRRNCDRCLAKAVREVGTESLCARCWDDLAEDQRASGEDVLIPEKTTKCIARKVGDAKCPCEECVALREFGL